MSKCSDIWILELLEHLIMQVLMGEKNVFMMIWNSVIPQFPCPPFPTGFEYSIVDKASVRNEEFLGLVLFCFN